MSTIFRISLLWASIFLLLPGSIQAEEVKGSDEGQVLRATETHAAIRHALPFIEREGVKWMEQRKCVTCHHSAFMVWSLNSAASHGFDVDAPKLAEHNQWVRDPRHIVGPDKKDIDPKSFAAFQESPAETSQLLLGRLISRATPADAEEQQWVYEMRSSLLKAQQADGSWKAGGQLPAQKRPLRESQETVTYWALLALHNSGPMDDSLTKANERALVWLKDSKNGESAEWWAAKMRYARTYGNPEVADQCREKLLQSQHHDGGWGWLLTDESDALGTGIVLHALLQDGLDRNAEENRRAVSYLVKSQLPDGSWPVKGTKKNKRDKIEPTATFWGTCWGVLGLVESLPVAKQ